MQKPLRCGLIGAGKMGRNHARVIHELPELELAVIADPGGDIHGIAREAPVVKDVSQALGYDLDCAIIAVPTRFHEEVAIEFARARVPVLIEKPLADTVESALRIIAEFDKTQTTAAVGHIERFNPAIQELTKRLRAKEIGQIFQISTRRQSSFTGRISDVGVVQDLATHDIDLVLALSGSSYAEVAAFTSRRSGQKNEEILVASGRLANETLVSHIVNWLSPLKERVTAVMGEGGTFVANTVTGDLELCRAGRTLTEWEAVASLRGVSEGEITRFAYPKIEPLKRELQEFARHVAGKQQSVVVSLTDGLRVVETVESVLSDAGLRKGNVRR